MRACAALGKKAGIGRPGCCPVDLWFKSVTREGVWTWPPSFAHACVFSIANTVKLLRLLRAYVVII